jgi:hypothetical protein
MTTKDIEYGSGRYIGRVGALAVALGIGVAIAAVPTVASADSTDSTDSTAGSASTGAAPSARERSTIRGSRTAVVNTGGSTSAPRSSAEGPAPSAATKRRGSTGTVDTSPVSKSASAVVVEPPRESAAPLSLPPSNEVAGPTHDAQPTFVSTGPVGLVRSAEATATSARPTQPAAPTLEWATPKAATQAAPVMVATPQAAASGSVSAPSALAWLGSHSNGDAPAAAPLAWAAAAVTRRESAAHPIADFIGIFVSNGTADHPDAGVLIGSGFSYDAQTCLGQTVCNGGKAGLLGNGGSGYNGGNGGAAGWFGNGGGGGGGLPGQSAGTGGRGGLFVGDGGSGGKGGDALAVGGIGGNGGDGGSTGLLSVWGRGGNGGAAGNGAAGGTESDGGDGGSGGRGGNGSWIFGTGGNGGGGGNGGDATYGIPGVGGVGGEAGVGRLLVLFKRVGTPGIDGRDGSAGGGCAGSCPPNRVFAPYIDMASTTQREETWYMNDSTDPTKPGTPSLVSTMTKTGIEAATLAFVNQQGRGGDFVWGSSDNPLGNIEFDTDPGKKIKADIQAAKDNGLNIIVSFGGITACQNGVEIGQLNGEAAALSSTPIAGTGAKSMTLTLNQPIDFAAMEPGTISGQIKINDAVTDLYTVGNSGTFTFTHQVSYQVPIATKGTIAPDGSAITFEFDREVTPNYGPVGTNLSYGIEAGFLRMKQAYKDAIQYFYDMGIRHFDLDIEGPALSIGQAGINNQRHRVFKAFQDENTFPDMELSYVLPIGPNTGWAPTVDPGRLIKAAGEIGLKVSTWNMMAFDYGPASYQYMLDNEANMVDMLIGEAETGITVDPYFPIKGAVQYLVDYGLATDTQDAFQKLGVTLMIGQDDTVYVKDATPEGFTAGDGAAVEAITPAQVGGTDPAAETVLNWALDKGVGLLSFWSLGRDRPSYNTTSYNPSLSVAYQTGTPAVGVLETTKIAGGGSASVTMAFTPTMSRTAKGGNLYNAGDAYLGTFAINPDNTLQFTYVPPALPVKATGGVIDPATGVLRVDFDGNVTDTIWSKVDLDPKILIEYQDQDLVYTRILDQFDD